MADYRDDYDRGWRYRGDLDHADRKGYTRSDAWQDGYADMSQGLAKWHRRDCPDTMGHQNCPVA